MSVTTLLGRRARPCQVTLLAGARPKALTAVDMELQPTADGVGYSLMLPHVPEMGSYPIVVRAASLEGMVRARGAVCRAQEPVELDNKCRCKS